MTFADRRNSVGRRWFRRRIRARRDDPQKVTRAGSRSIAPAGLFWSDPPKHAGGRGAAGARQTNRPRRRRADPRTGVLHWRARPPIRSEEHTSELQSLMRISYAVFCLKKKTSKKKNTSNKRK